MKKAVRLILEFPNKRRLAQFVEDFMDPVMGWTAAKTKVAAYRTDVLDKVKCDNRTFILRHKGARPESYEVKP